MKPVLVVCRSRFYNHQFRERFNNNTGIAKVVNADMTLALFEKYQHLPMTDSMFVMSILLTFTFLVISVDSATYILASMTTNGSLTLWLVAKIIWGFVMSVIAAGLLAGGRFAAL
nr:BCCT family transporter [Domibacillus robiginosus]